MATSVDKLKAALEAAAPEGRSLACFFRSDSRPSYVAVSDRGLFMEIPYECGEMNPTGNAENFWLVEQQAIAAFEYSTSEYAQVVAAVEKAGKFKVLTEQLAMCYPELMAAAGAVTVTDEMKVTAIRIGREILGNGFGFHHPVKLAHENGFRSAPGLKEIDRKQRERALEQISRIEREERQYYAGEEADRVCDCGGRIAKTPHSLTCPARSDG